nr:ribonuclease H-like domain-containing protein [Tanacetum cinerariifolium]
MQLDWAGNSWKAWVDFVGSLVYSGEGQRTKYPIYQPRTNYSHGLGNSKGFNGVTFGARRGGCHENVPMLKPAEFEIWRMRIEQYTQMIDYALWEVIENEKAQRWLEVKARSTLMMGISNEHQLLFNSIKDAKQLLEAVEKRFGFKSLNKVDFDTMSMDDLYNNLKVYKPEVKGMSSSSSSTQNMVLCPLQITTLAALIEQSDQAKEGPSYVLMAFSSLSFDSKVSDNEEENVSQPKIENKTVRPRIVKKEFGKSKQQEKTTRKTVKQVEKNRQNTHSPRGNQRNWNNMMSQKLGSTFEMFNRACYVCGSFDHL